MTRLPKRPFLYPIIDSVFSRNIVQDALEAIRAGVQVVQVRAKNLTKAEIFEILNQLEPICGEKHVLLIVNDHVDIALVLQNTGVHLGQDDFPVPDCRRILPHRTIGISTHNMEQFRSASELPVDYVAVGPIFPTATKESSRPALGTRFLQMVRPVTRLPIVCIGGIEEMHFSDLLKAGADGIAMISALYTGSGGLYSTISRMNEAIHR